MAQKNQDMNPFGNEGNGFTDETFSTASGFFGTSENIGNDPTGFTGFSAPGTGTDAGVPSGNTWGAQADIGFGTGENGPDFGDGNQSPGGDGRKKMLILLGCLAACVVLFFVLIAALDPNAGKKRVRADLMGGSVQTNVYLNKDNTYTLNLQYTVTTGSGESYEICFVLGAAGKDMTVVSDPVFVLGNSTRDVIADVEGIPAGTYSVSALCIPLRDDKSTGTLTSPQTVTVSMDMARAKPVITATPRPTATPTPRPVMPTAEPTRRPTDPPVPTATPAPRKQPSSSVFALYPAETRWKYNRLSNTEKQIFSEIYDQVAVGETEIFFTPCSRNTFEKVWDVITYDSPELFHLDYEEGYRYYSSFGEYTGIIVEYSLSQSEYQSQLQTIMNQIRNFSSMSGFAGNDFNKEMVIYQWIAEKSHYDKVLKYCSYADSVYIHHYSKCTGYAKALNLALRYYGIECIEIVGDTYDDGVKAPTGHEWSMVRLDGQWYHCDATWDDPGTDEESILLGGKTKYRGYGNLPDSLMLAARTVDSRYFTFPACNTYIENYNQVKSLYIPAGSDYQKVIRQTMKDVRASGGKEFGVQFASARDSVNFIRDMASTFKGLSIGYTYYTCKDVNYVFFCNLR